MCAPTKSEIETVADRVHSTMTNVVDLVAENSAAHPTQVCRTCVHQVDHLGHVSVTDRLTGADCERCEPDKHLVNLAVTQDRRMFVDTPKVVTDDDGVRHLRFSTIAHVGVVESCNQQILNKCKTCGNFRPVIMNIPTGDKTPAGAMRFRPMTVGGHCSIPPEGITVDGKVVRCHHVPKVSGVSASCANCAWLYRPGAEANDSFVHTPTPVNVDINPFVRHLLAADYPDSAGMMIEAVRRANARIPTGYTFFDAIVVSAPETVSVPKIVHDYDDLGRHACVGWVRDHHETVTLVSDWRTAWSLWGRFTVRPTSGPLGVLSLVGHMMVFQSRFQDAHRLQTVTVTRPVTGCGRIVHVERQVGEWTLRFLSGEFKVPVDDDRFVVLTTADGRNAKVGMLGWSFRRFALSLPTRRPARHLPSPSAGAPEYVWVQTWLKDPQSNGQVLGPLRRERVNVAVAPERIVPGCDLCGPVQACGFHSRDRVSYPVTDARGVVDTQVDFTSSPRRMSHPDCSPVRLDVHDGVLVLSGPLAVARNNFMALAHKAELMFGASGLGQLATAYARLLGAVPESPAGEYLGNFAAPAFWREPNAPVCAINEFDTLAATGRLSFLDQLAGTTLLRHAFAPSDVVETTSLPLAEMQRAVFAARNHRATGVRGLNFNAVFNDAFGTPRSSQSTNPVVNSLGHLQPDQFFCWPKAQERTEWERTSSALDRPLFLRPSLTELERINERWYRQAQASVTRSVVDWADFVAHAHVVELNPFGDTVESSGAADVAEYLDFLDRYEEVPTPSGVTRYTNRVLLTGTERFRSTSVGASLISDEVDLSTESFRAMDSAFVCISCGHSLRPDQVGDVDDRRCPECDNPVVFMDNSVAHERSLYRLQAEQVTVDEPYVRYGVGAAEAPDTAAWLSNVRLEACVCPHWTPQRFLGRVDYRRTT